MGWGAGVERVLLTGVVPLAVVVLGSAVAVVPVDPAVDGPDGRAVVAIDPVERLRAVTVLVHTTTCDGERTGTGVLLDGAVVTNAHVVDGASAVEVRFASGSWRTADAVRTAPDVDVAALEVGTEVGTEVDGEPGAGSERGPGLRTTPARPGTPVWTGGHPDGAELAVRRARVTRRRDRQVWSDPQVAVELDVVARPGQSGSPVLDASGRLVGLVYASAFDGSRALVIDGPELGSALAAIRSAAGRPGDGLVECPGDPGE